MYFAYILSCADGSFFIGTTTDITARLHYHSTGKNPFTANKLPVKIAYKKAFSVIQDVIAFVQILQSKTTAELKEIISGNKVVNYTPTNKIQTVVDLEKPLILPYTYMGNLAYFSEIKKQTSITFDEEEKFQKQTYRSRCSILSANGIQNLIVPVIRPKGKNTKMKEVEISYADNWQKDHLKAIQSAYGRSPYYAYYAEELFAILEKKHCLLIDLNIELTRFLIRSFGLDTLVKEQNNEDSVAVLYKIMVTPKNRFDYPKKNYHQVLNENGQFEQNLSVIDLLFNMGKMGIVLL